jgi:plastocyanin
VNLKMLRYSRWIASTCMVIGLSTTAFADVTGKVTLEGKLEDPKPIDMSAVKECAACHPDPVYPEDIVVGDNGELKNVVVSLKLADGQTAPGGDAAAKPPDKPAVIDQKGCLYDPHVTAVMTDQKIVFKNSDPTAHNVDTGGAENNENKVNQGMLKGAGEYTYTPKVAEAKPFKVKCDVHPWMSAWIAVFDHPYFAVTGDDGTFDIKGLPDGTYTIQAWQETLGTQEGKVTVKDGKATIDFKFKAPVKDKDKK